MNGPQIGELCAGYGGLAMAVKAVLGGELAFVADNDPGASAILAHRFPDVKNYGDIAAVDWAAVEPVAVLTAGFPCQDVSCAGARKGLRGGNRTGVWAYVAQVIDALRPPLVLLENVRGLLSAGADSDVEPCPWCLGEAGNQHPLRALGAVLGDLADLGYDARWAVVSAAAAGAPHRRERVFIIAWPTADADCGKLQRRGTSRVAGGSQAGELGEGDQRERAGHTAGDGGPVAPHADSTARGERRLAASGEAESGRAWADTGRRGGTPTADTDRRNAGEVHPGPDHVHRERPQVGWGPVVVAGADGAGVAGGGGTARQPASGREPAPGEPGSGGVTPADTDGSGRRPESRDDGRGRRGRLWAAGHGPGDIAWGNYESAIRRWEAVLGRPAPPPTEPGRTGDRLSPRFVEWLQGLPAGWVTDVPGLSRAAQLKALGNGVVPQQGALALRLLLPHMNAEVAA